MSRAWSYIQGRHSGFESEGVQFCEQSERNFFFDFPYSVFGLPGENMEQNTVQFSLL